jgi:hypothetical protein
MPKRSKSAVDERVKCEAPAEEFVGFARGIAEARSRNRLRALAEGPAAQAFAKRLILEALGGSPHAVTCLKLIGRLGEETSWAAGLRQVDAAGQLPSVDALKPKDMEPVGRGLLVISPRLALPWIAGAYLVARGGTVAGVEALLLKAASTTGTLAEALNTAVGALQARGLPHTARVFGRCIDALEKLACPPAASGEGAQELPLVQLARGTKRTEAARVLAALLPAVFAGKAGAGTAEEPPINEITEAAWSDADEALGRALRDMDFMARSFDRLETAAEGGLADPARKAKNATNLVLQWVRQAARYRKVATRHETGDHVPFDPAMHDLDGEAEMGELIRIVKPAIVRGTEPHQVVLLRAQAEPE